jgi:predicted nucleotidyltransferase
MRYKIDSAKTGFAGDVLIPFFRALESACLRRGTSYFVVGAFVRDIILEQIYGDRGGVETKDVDVAIYLEDWEQYESIIDDLTTNFGFVREPGSTHAFRTPRGLPTDIVPYGAIEVNRRISFPKSKWRSMNMLGFREVVEFTHEIEIDGQVTIKIPSVEGIVLIKLFAWNDRGGPYDLKDITDIGLLLDGYFDANLNEIYAREDQAEIEAFAGAPFMHQALSAGVIARKIKPMITDSPQLRRELSELLALFKREGKTHPVVLRLAKVFGSSPEDAARVMRTFTYFIG